MTSYRAISFAALFLFIGCAITSAATGVAAGTWTGTIAAEKAKPMGVRFEIEEKDGKLIGRTYFQDQGTAEYAIEGTISGTLDGTNATWVSESDLKVKGKFESNKFTGTLEFPPDEGHPAVTQTLTLTR